MRPYFEKMQDWGKPVKENKANADEIKKVEAEIDELVQVAKNAGISQEVLNKRGEWTVHQRLAYIVDPGTWCPLHTLYDPLKEESGTTGVVDGLGKINGRWCVIIGFDNKVMAGAWIAGQPHNILRVTDIAKRLHCPLVWLVNCSGVKLPEQEKMYADRRGSGTTFLGMLN
jgi:glutaconyl-CoA decarboxylase